MIKSHKKFLKCIDLKCEDVVSKEEFEKAQNQYNSDIDKKCKKHKVISKKIKCIQSCLSKSKYRKLNIERNKCAFKRCAKEFASFRKESAKKFKNNRKHKNSNKNKKGPKNPKNSKKSKKNIK